MIRVYLIGMLGGVMTMAAVTLLFAIPANNFHWQMEIYNRGGAAWTVDKDGQVGWKWMLERKTDTPREQRATLPVSKVTTRTEKL